MHHDHTAAWLFGCAACAFLGAAWGYFLRDIADVWDRYRVHRRMRKDDV